MILCFLKSKFVFQSAFSNKTASYCNSFLIFKRTKKKFSIKILSRTVCIVFNKLVEFSLKRNCLSCFKAFRIDGGFSFFCCYINMNVARICHIFQNQFIYWILMSILCLKWAWYVENVAAFWSRHSKKAENEIFKWG